MKLNHIIKLSALGSVLLFSSCNDFDDINDNPDAPTQPASQFLLTEVLYQSGDQTTTNGFVNTAPMMQYYGQDDFNDVDHYNIQSNYPLWTLNYKLIGNLNDILADTRSNQAMKATAKIMKAFIGAQLTDLYGPVPFLEAGYADNITPKYDQQNEVYTAENGVLSLLEQAVAELSTANGQIQGDIMFNGDKTKWIKFANALQIKYLLRIAHVHPQAKSRLQSLADGGELFMNNDDNALISYGFEPNNWYLSKERSGSYKLLRITTTMLTMFQDREDPRLAFYFAPNDQGEYVPLEPGSNERDGSYTGLQDDNYRSPNVLDMVFATYFGQEFAISEAIKRGYITGDAKMHYDNAVKAAFEYRHVEIPTDYLTTASKGEWNNSLERILTQKFLANNTIGFEGWLDYKRTGLPNLAPALNNENGDRIPMRFKYPSEESFANADHYNQAINWIGQNNYDSRSWWEKN